MTKETEWVVYSEDENGEKEVFRGDATGAAIWLDQQQDSWAYWVKDQAGELEYEAAEFCDLYNEGQL